MTADARNELPCEVLASAEMRVALEHGKYSRWVVGVAADQLQAALFAVGEFGNRFAATRLPDGGFPLLDRALAGMPLCRVFDALKTFALIRSESRCDSVMASGWPEAFSDTSPAFSQEFRACLCADSETAWAAELDQRSFALIIWMIGELAIRFGPQFWLDYPESPFGPVFFSKDHSACREMSAALQVIGLIASGSPLTTENAKRILELSHSGPEHAGPDCINDQLIAAEFVRFSPDADGMAIEVRSIHWNGSHESNAKWNRYATAPAAAGIDVRNDLIKTVLGDRKYFGICSLCGRRKPVGWMLDGSTCQACGEQHLGVVH